MKYLLAVLFAGASLPAFAQSDVMPAERITPGMIAHFAATYPEAAVSCLKESLAKVLDSKLDYLFTSDFQRGQLWLLSVDGMKGANVMSYICTPKGLAATPQEAMEAMLGGMGL